MNIKRYRDVPAGAADGWGFVEDSAGEWVRYQDIEDILTKDRLKTREINILTQENRALRKVDTSGLGPISHSDAAYLTGASDMLAPRSTCRHPPEARDITFCRLCMQPLSSEEQS